jgi:prephenate dehydratase
MKIGCLGPEGSFSHLLALQVDNVVDVSLCGSITAVFNQLLNDEIDLALVPIENSSGGFIMETADELIHHDQQIHIIKEYALDVKLALLGQSSQNIETIHSHAMPFFHCDDWLTQHYPNAKRIVESSTAKAAQWAKLHASAAAIGPIQNAKKHDLEIIAYPLQSDIANVTQFYLVSKKIPSHPILPPRLAMVVDLPNTPGSLCQFLLPFKQYQINLSRLLSRPIRGKPNSYRFFVEIQRDDQEASAAILRACLDQVKQEGSLIHELGYFDVAELKHV